MYADWWYAWCLTYFMGTHKDVFIVLKKSLKWVPIIGWVHNIFAALICAKLTLYCYLGHAILQIHIPRPVMGIRPYPTRNTSLRSWPASRERRQTFDSDIISGRDSC